MNLEPNGAARPLPRIDRGWLVGRLVVTGKGGWGVRGLIEPLSSIRRGTRYMTTPPHHKTIRREDEGAHLRAKLR